MDFRKLFEETYYGILLNNIEHRKLALEANISSEVLDEKYSESNIFFEIEADKEYIIFEKSLNFLIDIKELFVSIHNIKQKHIRKLIIRSLKKQFRKVEKDTRKNDQEYLLKSNERAEAEDKFMKVIDEEDKAIFFKLTEIDDKLFLMEQEFLFKTMIIVSKFVAESEKITKLEFFDNKNSGAATPE